MLETLIAQLKLAPSVVLSTHRNSDGDGLGAQMALFYGLRQLGKQVCIVNPDRPPKKYAFLDVNDQVRVFGEVAIPRSALALVFDTNDQRLLGPLMGALQTSCEHVLFIDHHPLLQHGPAPTNGSLIDTSAASTGEIAYRLLKGLGVTFTADIARALYTSVVFDTQLFRYVKSDPRSHVIAADLLRYEKNPEAVHSALFATYTVKKMGFLASSLSLVEYVANGQVAFLSLSNAQAHSNGLNPDENAAVSADVIDLVMNIESVQLGALLREEKTGVFKLSLRSKGGVHVLPIAESFGGGGHPCASGAYLQGDRIQLRAQLLDRMTALVEHGQGNAT